MDTQQTIEWNQHLDRGSDPPESPRQHELQDSQDFKPGFQRLNAASHLSVDEQAEAIASVEASAPVKIEDNAPHAEALANKGDDAESLEPLKDIPDLAKTSPDDEADAKSPEPMKDLPDLAEPSPDEEADAKSLEPIKDPAEASSDEAADASFEPRKDLPDLAKASPKKSTGGPRMSADGEVGSPELLECKVGLGLFT